MDLLAEWCEINHVLHKDKIDTRRKQSMIDTVARVIRSVRESWTERKLGGIFLIDIKGAFDYMSRNCLLRTIDDIGTNGNLMRWTESIMSNRSVGLVINDHHCAKAGVETGVPQKSSVSLILFTIYLSGFLREVEKEVE